MCSLTYRCYGGLVKLYLKFENWDTIYLDFDSVPQQRQLHRLSAYGIRGTTDVMDQRLSY